MLRKKTSSQSGQSLVEVLVAVAVIVLVLVAIVSRVVEATRNANFARNQLLSSRFAQEGIEWARSQRDRMGWVEFENRILTDIVPVTYCVLDLSEDLTCIPAGTCTSLSIGSCTGTITGTLFDREVTMDHTDIGSPDIGNYVDMTVIVSWQDRIGDHSTKLSTRLSDWTK